MRLTVGFRWGNRKDPLNRIWAPRWSWFERYLDWGTLETRCHFKLRLRVQILGPLLRLVQSRAQPSQALEVSRRTLFRAREAGRRPWWQAPFASNCAVLRKKVHWDGQVCPQLHEAPLRSGVLWWGIHYQVVRTQSQTGQVLRSLWSQGWKDLQRSHWSLCHMATVSVPTNSLSISTSITADYATQGWGAYSRTSQPILMPRSNYAMQYYTKY